MKHPGQEKSTKLWPLVVILKCFFMILQFLSNKHLWMTYCHISAFTWNSKQNLGRTVMDAFSVSQHSINVIPTTEWLLTGYDTVGWRPDLETSLLSDKLRVVYLILFRIFSVYTKCTAGNVSIIRRCKKGLCQYISRFTQLSPHSLSGYFVKNKVYTRGWVIETFII